MSITALFIFTDGIEELEAVAPLDILRRSGVHCTSASQTDNLTVTGRNQITLLADSLLDDVLENTYDLLVIPGGPGVTALRKDSRVLKLTQDHANAGKKVAAICAAPTLLHDAGLLENRSYTAHFTVADELLNIIPSSAVVIDGNIITSRGAGTAIEFGLKLAELTVGPDKAKEVADSIHFQTR
jgi:protein deglycase